MVPDLIIDVGMHNGNDTAFYLHKGYRVVAIEANPLFAASGRERFQQEIAENRLTILNVGIADKAGPLTFWVNDSNSEWSSFDQAIGCRQGTACHSLVVDCIPFEDVLAEFGVPYYLKIDIEFYDKYCLRALRPDDLPKYLSVEAHTFDYLCMLNRLGYNAFKCLNQSDHNDFSRYWADNPPPVRETRWQRIHRVGRRVLGLPAIVAADVQERLEGIAAAQQKNPNADWVFQPGSSGPFGDETYGEWQRIEAMTYNWLHFYLKFHERGTLEAGGWADFHATKR